MDPGAVSQLLARTPMFDALAPEDLAELAATCGERSYRGGETVFRQGDPGDALYVVAEGLVKIVLTSPSGDEMVLAALSPPDVFGELAVVDGGARSATAEALEPTRLVTLARSSLLGTMQRRPSVAEVMLRALGSLVRRSNEQVSDLIFLDLHGRVAKLLAGLAERGNGSELDLGMTQRDLASMVGGSRQSVNLILHEFERREFLELRQRTVIVKDLDALRRRAGIAR